MFLNLNGLFRQFLNFRIGQREAIALLLRHVFDFHLFAMFLAWGVDHTDFFGTHCAAHDRRTVSRQRRFVYVEFIWIDRALHHHFAQTPGGSDKHHLVETGFSVNGEHHAG
ncbi:hypothetical protein D3C71_1284960 [compost metagenome]